MADLAMPTGMTNMRFIVYDFLGGSPILIDCAAQTLTFYSSNASGAICNLRKPDCIAVDTKMKRALFRRTRGANYPHTGKAVDKYIFAYLLTPEEREKCLRKPQKIYDKKIVETNSFHEAIKEICGCAYDCEHDGGDRAIEDKALFLQYCDNFLQENPSPPMPPKERGIGAR